MNNQYGKGAFTYEPEIQNPYKNINLNNLKSIAKDRSIPIVNNCHQLIDALIQNDKDTNNQYKKAIFSKNMFSLTDFNELAFLAGVYNIDISNYHPNHIKNLLYIFMIMPAFNKTTNLSSYPYLEKINTKVKRFALLCYNPIGIDIELLTDSEMDQLFVTGQIPTDYIEYRDRETRLQYLSNLPEFIQSNYIKSFETDLYNIIRNTKSDQFEQMLNINYQNQDLFEDLIDKIGISLPFRKGK